MTNNAEHITQEELSLIRESQKKVVLAVTQAERAVALSQVAELESKNIILSIFNKYGLNPNTGAISGEGQIVRRQIAAVDPITEIIPTENTEEHKEHNE